MAGIGGTAISRGRRTSAVATVSGIALVLFMLGLVSALVLGTNQVKKMVKEDFTVDVFFFDSSREADMHQLEKTLLQEPYVKSIRYITSQEAFEMIKDDIGMDDPLEPLGGEIPINPSLEIRLSEAYVHPDSVQKITDNIATMHADLVQEVNFDKDLLLDINHNINNLILIILGFAALLLIVAIAMINNTIRLAVYSKRFLIKTMTLVGARPMFIRRPFIISAVLQGIVAGMVAISLIIGFFMLLNNIAAGVFDVATLLDLKTYALLFACIVLLGIIISWFSTFFALRKYLRIKMDDLY
jgi:cell division transport system permease protein